LVAFASSKTQEAASGAGERCAPQAALAVALLDLADFGVEPR
jgi:hypothetical protein